MNVGYQTSKNRVSMGLSLSEERAFKLRRLAADLGVSVAEQVGRLVDAEWSRIKRTDDRAEASQNVEAA
jgi:hypothetical protein